jgi:hypothetical protein
MCSTRVCDRTASWSTVVKQCDDYCTRHETVRKALQRKGLKDQKEMWDKPAWLQEEVEGAAPSPNICNSNVNSENRNTLKLAFCQAQVIVLSLLLDL